LLTVNVGRTESPERFEMVAEPVGQFAPIEPASGQIEYKALLGVDGGIDLGTVEYQECLHGGMPDTLVAIDERMALNQRQTQRRGLLSESGIQVTTTERGLGLGDCGLQRTEVPDAGRAPGRPEEAPIDRKSTRLNSSHDQISYAVFCLKKKKKT